MGRGAGCCNFKYTVNCTAPPCPTGSCCYVDASNLSRYGDENRISIEHPLETYICEESVTENCCLAKPFSFFSKGATCGEFEICDGQSSIAMPMVASTDKAFALLKHDGSVVTWGTFPLAIYDASPKTDKAQNATLTSNGETPHKNIVDIVANKNAFLFLDKDGWYTTWGDPAFGGGISNTFATPNYVDEYNFGCERNSAQDCVTSEQIPQPRSRLKKGSIVPINTGLRQIDQVTSIDDEEDISFRYERGASVISRGGFAGISLEGKLVIFYSDLHVDPNKQPENLTPPFVLTFGGNNDGMELELPAEVKDKTDIVEIATFDHYVAVRDSSDRIFILELPRISGSQQSGFSIKNSLRMAGDRRDVNKDGTISVSDAYIILTALNSTLKQAQENPDLEADLYNSALDVNKDGKVTAGDCLQIINALSIIGGHSYDSGFTNVKKIYSNRHAFAFLKNDGTVLTWGDGSRGGNTGTKHSLLTNVKEIYNTDSAFLAHRTDNKIVVWGYINTTAGPDSDFYSEVIDVFPSKNAFGISYLIRRDNYPSTGTTMLDQYFTIIGDVVRNRETEAQVVHPRSSSPYPETYTGHRSDINRSPINVHIGHQFFPLSYTPPYDHENRPISLDGNPSARFKRDFYASDYVFHFRTGSFFLAPHNGAGFYLIGQSSLGGRVNDEYYSHRADLTRAYEKFLPGFGLTLKKGGVDPQNIFRDECSLLDHPAKFDRNTGTQEKLIIKGAKNYVFNRRATAFLVDGNGLSHNHRRRYFGSPSLGKDYVVSLGHADYGGIGSSFLKVHDNFGRVTYPNDCASIEDCLETSRTINQLAFPSLIPPFTITDTQRANFVGLYSNRHAFCGVRIHDNVTRGEYGLDGRDGQIHRDNQDGKIRFGGGRSSTYEIFTWGDDDFGGDSSDVDFSNVFANIKNIIFTHEGCHPDYCNQDIK